jgi:hypothetical protein
MHGVLTVEIWRGHFFSVQLLFLQTPRGFDYYLEQGFWGFGHAAREPVA